MPAPLNPPFEAGALVQPRTLQRWLDVNKVNRLTRGETYFTVPAFNLPVDWNGYSNLVQAFDYVATNNFSIKLNKTTFPINPNYIACVVWEDSNLVMHRYKLWENVGEVFFFDVPLYTHQEIKKNFRIEIWTINPNLNTFVLSGAANPALNVLYTYNPVNDSWEDATTLNRIFIQGGTWVLKRIGATKYTNPSLITGLPFGQWVDAGGGLPVPTTIITSNCTQLTAFNIYSSILQQYDYRYVNDVACTNIVSVRALFSAVLPANLPMTFPANSSPQLN